jgi:hypothetical protein
MDINIIKSGRKNHEHITKRYVPIDVIDADSLSNLPVILSFGKVLPALLAGDAVVLRTCRYNNPELLSIKINSLETLLSVDDRFFRKGL